MATIRPYKNGFRTYTITGYPVSRKPICLEGAVQQKHALIPGKENIRGYSLTDADIKTIIPTLKVITYPELLEFNNIDDILDEKGRLMILYLTEDKHTGHWTCLLRSRDKKKLEYFDSYGGLKPDQESSWLSNSKLREFHQDTHHLTELLQKCPYKVVYNRYPFQEEDLGIMTCGRHCVTRLYFKHLTLPQYTQMVLDSGINPDDFVSNFTYKMIGK